MTFEFQNWVLTRQEERPDRQYDHLSGTLTVTGTPEGYRFDMLVQAGGRFDKWPLSQMEGGVGTALTKDMLSVDGRYSMQLVGTDGTTVRHTNVVQVYVPCSLSGDAHWPTLPREFSQAEERMRELNSHPPVPGTEGCWQLWDPDSRKYTDSEFPLPKDNQEAMLDNSARMGIATGSFPTEAGKAHSSRLHRIPVSFRTGGVLKIALTPSQPVTGVTAVVYGVRGETYTQLGGVTLGAFSVFAAPSDFDEIGIYIPAMSEGNRIFAEVEHAGIYTGSEYTMQGMERGMLKNLLGDDHTKLYPVSIPKDTPLVMSTSDGSVMKLPNFRLALYREDKTQICTCTFYQNQKFRWFLTPEDVRYMKWIDTYEVPLQLEYGYVPSRYVPYTETLLSLQAHTDDALSGIRDTLNSANLIRTLPNPKFEFGNTNSSGDYGRTNTKANFTHETRVVLSDSGKITLRNFTDNNMWFILHRWTDKYDGIVMRQIVNAHETYEAYIDASGEYRLQFTKQYGVLGTDAELAAIGENVSIEQFSIPEMKSKTAGVLLEMARHIPANAAKPLTVLHFSDIHGDAAALHRILSDSKKYAKIDDMICTGDMVTGSGGEIASWWEPRVMTCIGNHDTAQYSGGSYQWTALSMADREAYYITPFKSAWGGVVHQSGASYYYKDYAAQHVRLIVLDAMLYQDNGGDEQNAWLSGLLDSAITAGLHVLIAAHAPHGGAKPVGCSFTRLGEKDMPARGDCDLPEAVIGTVAEKIAGGLNFVGYLCGHTHQDAVWDAAGDGSQLMYCVTCAAVDQEAQWRGSDQFRSVNADAYNLVTVDTANRLVKLIRGGGADSDDHMRARRAICIDYGSGIVAGEMT